MGSMVFAVSPALPEGLSLDPVTGVIRGIPLHPQPGSRFFVTACEPRDKIHQIFASMVDIRIFF